MDYFKILKIVEEDIDEIVEASGGFSIPTRDKDEKKTADYILNESIIELKLIEEEGLNKKTRQNKLKDLFEQNQLDKPTVIIDKKLLNEEELVKFYRILEGPIKKRLQKSSKQLKNTVADLYPGKLKISMIINVGYSSLDMEDFKKVAIKIAKNDTKNIDYLIIGGVYFYGDEFDFYSFFPFDLIKIQDTNEFESFDILRDQWNILSEKIMTEMIMPQESNRTRKTIDYDIEFERDNKYYVKLTPLIGKKSDFYINGRPRKNTTGINQCPPVAKTFPYLQHRDWKKLKDILLDEYELQESYIQYCDLIKDDKGSLIMPIVPINISYNSFFDYCRDNNYSYTFQNLCIFATEVFQNKITTIHKSIINLNMNKILPVEYIYLYVEEIGQDKKFDISSLYHIKYSSIKNKYESTIIFENERIFFEYSSILASSYAVKYKTDIVCYEINKDFAWQ